MRGQLQTAVRRLCAENDGIALILLSKFFNPF
jgi:hypothetical protein